MRKMKNIGKKALMSALAISVGAVASANAVDNALKDPLFGLKEVSSHSILIAHEGKCGEGKCGEGKCGEGKCGEKKAVDKAKASEGKCGVKKLKKVFKKDKKVEAAKSAEGKCGEGKCGAEKSGSKK